MWPGKKILIMGLGLHGGGVAVARWFVRAGARVTVTDLKSARELASSLSELGFYRRKITFVLGRHRAGDFRNADLVIQNPGVPRESKYLDLARRAGVRLENEASLFVRLVGRERIIGVTGTRGKSTTAALVYEMVKRKYPRAILAGNIRIPMFDQLDRALKTSAPIILELSSWHLEGMGEHGLSPYVAVVTNVLVDHLNRYKSMADYGRAKEQIWRHQTHQDIVVLNRDNPITRAMASHVSSRVIWFSVKKSSPLLASLRLQGEHNRANAWAAITAARALKVSLSAIRAALQKFSGLTGRLEVIGKHRGVTFINDTTATTPDATLAALSTIKGPIILIAGGSDKKLDYRALAQEIRQRCKSVVLLPGSATDKLVRAMLNVKTQMSNQISNPNVKLVSSMVEAVRKVVRLSVRGDTILLSPGAASFGLFKHEFDRGDQFVRAVKDL